MNICIFDTETIGLDKPYCYNIGYCIVNTETKTVIAKYDFIVEQIWHNIELFNTAYYANKKPIYVKAMRSRKTIMDKFGYICQQMIRDFKAYNISYAYAYNSSFDERVFDYNCEWFRCINPFDNIQILDIRAFAIKAFCHEQYFDFCEKNQYFTDSMNYSTTAEIMYRFISNNNDFIEDHTALSDSLIESEILMQAFNKGIDITEEIEAPKSIKRKVKKKLHLQDTNKNDYYFDYETMRISKDRTEIKLK